VVFSTDPTKPTLVALDALTPLALGNYLLFAGGANTDYANVTTGPGGVITSGLSLAVSAAYPTSDIFMMDGDIYVHVVPEPGTWALLLMGAIALACRGWWMRRRKLSVEDFGEIPQVTACSRLPEMFYLARRVGENGRRRWSNSQRALSFPDAMNCDSHEIPSLFIRLLPESRDGHRPGRSSDSCR
jgi:hypothetical protein